MAYDGEGELEKLVSANGEEGLAGKAEPSVRVDTAESRHDHGKEDAPDLHVPSTTSSPANSTEGAQTPDVSSGRSKKGPVSTRTKRGE